MTLSARTLRSLTQPLDAGTTCQRWLAPDVIDHWWTQVPLVTPPMARSMTLPVKRLRMRY